MAAYDITAPDGRVYEITAPDNATPEQLNQVASQFIASLPQRGAAPAAPTTSVAPKPSFGEQALKFGGDVATGAVVGATDIGRSLMKLAPQIAEFGPLKHLQKYNPIHEPVKRYLAETEQRAGEIANEMYGQTGAGGFVGRMIPQALGTVGLGGPVQAAVKGAATHLPKLRAATPYVTASAAGAGGGALTTPDAPGTGAAVGAVLGPAFVQAGKMFTGPKKAPDVGVLQSAGTEMTPGQMADKRTLAGRTLSRAESALTSLPFVGDIIRGRQQKALDTFRQGAIERGQPPGARPLKADQSVDQMIFQQAQDFENAYRPATVGKTFRPDEQLERKITEILFDPERTLSQVERDKITDHVERAIFSQIRGGPMAGAPRAAPTGPPLSTSTAMTAPRTPGTAVGAPGGGAVTRPGYMPPGGGGAPGGAPAPTAPGGGQFPIAEWGGEQLMRGQSALRKAGFKYGTSGDPITRDMGFALRDIADEIYNLIGRQDEAAGQILQALRGPYSAHKVVSEASRKAPKMGEFTPRQLAQQAQRGKHQELQTYGRVGSELLPETIPESGTAARIFWALSPLMLPKLAAGAAATGALYGTKIGRKIVSGDTAPQRMTADILKKMEY